jgi:hypothetical protein
VPPLLLLLLLLLLLPLLLLPLCSDADARAQPVGVTIDVGSLADDLSWSGLPALHDGSVAAALLRVSEEVSRCWGARGMMGMMSGGQAVHRQEQRGVMIKCGLAQTPVALN